jgi:hypothetical protein
MDREPGEGLVAAYCMHGESEALPQRLSTEARAESMAVSTWSAWRMSPSTSRTALSAWYRG